MKKSEAFGRINAMSGVVKLKDIITLIISIDNFQYDTLDKLNPVDDYLEGIPISEIYVDLSYFRLFYLSDFDEIIVAIRVSPVFGPGHMGFCFIAFTIISRVTRCFLIIYLTRNN